MKKKLKTFYGATCIFSGTKYPTSNLYFKSVFMVHSRLIEAASEGESFMTPMVTEMKKKFDKYWTDYSSVVSCAAVIDPRYKLELLSFCYGNFMVMMVIFVLRRLKTQWKNFLRDTVAMLFILLLISLV
jgi:hypothetical protein